MKFTKMHGTGNDYIYVNCLQEEVPNPPETAKILSDRHFGIGADGLVLILPSQTADFRMRMFNADGSEAEMCGNASRCVGKYIYEYGLSTKTEIALETLAGIKILDLNLQNGRVADVTVNMGPPTLATTQIPVDSTLPNFINQPLTVQDREYHVTCVSMGNPHAIVFVEDPHALDLPKIGPGFENHPLFPNRINTEFVHVIDRTHLDMRVWERGSGETLACGTGACAVIVAAVLNGLTERKARITLLGGDLDLEWRESDNNVYKTGPAEIVFEGEILI